MTFADIGGNISQLDDVLRLCLTSGIFHPEYAAKLSEYSVGSATLARNPYGALLVKINDIASQLKIDLAYREYGSEYVEQEEFISATHEYLNGLRRTYPEFFENQRKIMDEMTSYSTALEMLSHVNVSDINFDNIWDNEFLKIRFGRLPAENMPKLEAYEENPYELYRLDETPRNVWCLYFTAEEYREEIDKLFYSLGFERLRVPDYVHGTPAEAVAQIRASLESERSGLEGSMADIAEFVETEREGFLRAYSHVKFLHDAYDLRKYVVSIREKFHLVGFVLAKDRDRFARLLEYIPGLETDLSDAVHRDRLPVPVQLRNNWFVRPFEMFVKMYGSPSYSDIDPSPFLAYTYTILFGLMFGDMGQGLCVLLLGMFLWKKKGMELGSIMTRIGVASMFVGFWYGSVFGFEHLLNPFFKVVMGLESKPIEVLHPDTTTKILLAAVGLGAVSIMSAIAFNIIIGFKQRNYDRTLLSSNGLCGFVFYAAVLFGAIVTITGGTAFTLPYVLLLIALPLLIIFFREPIARYAHLVNNDTMISHDADLLQNNLLSQSGTSIPELFSSPFMTARFGRIPTESYQKLSFYTNEPFMLYPVKIDPEYIWLIYATPQPNKAEIDAIFHDLYFERIYIPDEELRTEEEAVEFIKKCVEHGTPLDSAEKFAPVAPSKPRSLYRQMFPEGFGNFFTETFFEMFEVILSFISNTMSFLRVGGFILVHVGMMSVVFTLAQMVNSGGASVSIIIIGNAFVMVLEGLIVGIQVLRLEFYELFSRFYGNYGDPFTPVTVEYPPVRP